jgi:hypothetical protein
MLWDEALVINRRVNRHNRNLAVLINAAVGSAKAGGRRGTAALNKFLENFDDG